MKPRLEIPSGPYLVVGLARSGIAAALALRARNEQVVGLDAGSPLGMDALREAGVEIFIDDRDGIALLDRIGAVVKSPGVPAGAPVIAEARERELPVLGELELAWRLLENEFIAVTGTNGKTTTVELIGHIHREAGLPVAVAGNVGTALSSLIGALEPAATVVCEASSFQLEDTLEFAPEGAVLLNITPDHLDRHSTLEAYVAAKLEIFARQGAEGVAVTPADLGERIAWAEESKGLGTPAIPGDARRVDFGWDSSAALFELDGELWWQGQPLIALEEMRLRGRHNVENAMAAAAVCLARGVDREAVHAGLASFGGVAHRLEEIVELDGVLYVNDSKATNVASTLVALDAFAGRPVHLILGGQGKGQDFASLRGPVQRCCAAVYLIGEDAPTIAVALGNIAPPMSECGELASALAMARQSIAGDPSVAA
ncbi:MAG TPA: UDP-N-acetylmuramoyl-L-alanine--D-glutamate ligase, partial [Solirubrobacteraceae bacterium]|nr:UDP-N-acetylmuramoyl-L-alanine--D-glutamate ligase [Solirubrobacteraceae bacterium]